MASYLSEPLFWELHPDFQNFRLAQVIDLSASAWMDLLRSPGKALTDIWKPVSVYFPESDEDREEEREDDEIPNELLPIGDLIPTIDGVPIFNQQAVDVLYSLIAN